MGVPYGRLTEWFMVLVLKTSGGKTSVGSNPTPSSIKLIPNVTNIGGAKPLQQNTHSKVLVSKHSWRLLLWLMAAIGYYIKQGYSALPSGEMIYLLAVLKRIRCLCDVMALPTR